MTFAAIAAAATAPCPSARCGPPTGRMDRVEGLAAQPVIPITAASQLYAGVPASKAEELRRLGVRLYLGVAANLAYSALNASVFAWLAVRWRRRNRGGAGPWGLGVS